MTDATLIQWIEELNNGSDKSKYLTRYIGCTDSEEVFSCIIWKEILEEGRIVDDRNYCYFIKSSDNIIGVVYLMKNIFNQVSDLHYLLLEEHRKQGHLTKSMQEVILPHIFWKDGMEKLRISIDEAVIGSDNHTASIRVALALGFLELEDSSIYHILTADKVKDYKPLDKIYDEIEESYLSTSLIQINNKMQYLRDRMEQYQGNQDMVEDLEHFAKQLVIMSDEIRHLKTANN